MAFQHEIWQNNTVQAWNLGVHQLNNDEVRGFEATKDLFFFTGKWIENGDFYGVLNQDVQTH